MLGPLAREQKRTEVLKEFGLEKWARVHWGDLCS